MDPRPLGEALYEPTPARIAESRLTAFMNSASALSGARLENYDQLWQWSVDESESFWSLLWDFCEVVGEKGKTVVEDLDRMPGAKWFPEARLNYAENLLRGDADREILIARDESARRRCLTRTELREEVSRCQQALVEAGVGSGDRVAAYMPNTIETVVGMLATASLGAVWSSCSPDFGVSGALDRLAQIEPKVLIAADGYRYADKPRPALDRLHELIAGLATVKKVIVAEHLSDVPVDLSDLRAAVRWRDDVSARDAKPLTFEAVPFDHPLYVMYSSGTTGLPKAIVHGAGGTLLQHLKELVLHTNLKAGDSIAYYTTCGWMMWNWLVSALAVDTSVVLIDGSPFHPRASRLFDIAEDESLTVLGVSAKFLAMAEKRGLQPGRTHDLSSLRVVLSTGSPLAPESFDWVYTELKSDVLLASISGGTDIISCFALGNPINAVRRGELQCRGLGMKVEIFDDAGRPLPAGQPGELVCTRAFPSMPVGFWNDEDGSRYRNAYFEHFDGIWRHGDWATITESGGMVFHGRSDATLNPGGVRIGTAEIYRVIESFDEVVEAVVVGQRWDDDQRIVLFVRMHEGRGLDDELRERMRVAVRTQASPHHVPKVVVSVPDLPRTISGKVSEIAVRKILHGEAVDNRESLANPEVLEVFRNFTGLGH